MNTVLQQKIIEGKLPSPVLFIGPKQTVNVELGKDIAKQLFGEEHHSKINSGNHPDVHVYSPEGKSALHPMANIQRLIADMAYPPFEAPYSIFILEDAEKMLPSSSNALLKTLEEPSPTSFFVLLTEHPDALLPTVRSRLHLFRFSSSITQISLEIREKIIQSINLAKEGLWHQFFKEISTLETIEVDAVLENILHWIKDQKISKAFFLCVQLIDEAQLSLRHNIKWRNVLVHLLIRISTQFPNPSQFCAKR